MVVAEEGLAPVGGPLDRPVQLARGEHRQDVFRIHEDLHAEAAADIGRQDVELLFRLVEDLGGELGPHAVDALARHVEDVAVLVVDGGEAGPAFHRRRGDPVVDQVDADDLGGLGEAGLGRRLVTLFPEEAEVTGSLFPHLRGVGCQRTGGVGDRGKLAVIDEDQLAGVARGIQRFGDDEGDGIADMADAALGEGRARRHHQRRAVLLDQRNVAGNVLDAGRFQVFDGVDRQDAGGVAGFFKVDGNDLGVGLRRPQDIGVCLTRQGDVVGIAPASSQQAGIFGTRNRLANAELGHVLFNPPDGTRFGELFVWPAGPLHRPTGGIEFKRHMPDDKPRNRSRLSCNVAHGWNRLGDGYVAGKAMRWK